MTATPNDDRHILALDAIRGLAAISVLLIHIGWISGERSMARFAFTAVDLFFMMSGFVIGRAYEARLLGGMPSHRFLLLRAARLYPSMFLGVLAGLVAHLVIPGGTYHLGWYSAGHLVLIPDLTAAEGLFPLNGVLWTLFFELAINVAPALTVRWLTTARLALVTLAMGACWYFAATSSNNWGGGWNRETFLYGVARVGWGYGAGLLLHRLVDGRSKVPAVVPFVLAALMLLLPSFGKPLARVPISVFVLCPVIIALAAISATPRVGSGVGRWLGGISYPLYAIHHPLLMMAAWRFQVTGRAWGAVALAIVALATLVEYAYDVPLRRRLLAAAEQPRQSSR